MRLLLFLAALLFLSACSSVDLDPRAPAGFDLTGSWQINPSLSDMPPGPRTQGDPVQRNARASQVRGVRNVMGFLADDFPVLGASRLKVEQNRDSMGVEFDRGAYRDVSWGFRERGMWEIWAGWEEGVLVILSEANDLKARETIHLEEGGDRMVVNLQVEANRREVELIRVFDRVE